MFIHASHPLTTPTCRTTARMYVTSSWGVLSLKPSDARGDLTRSGRVGHLLLLGTCSFLFLHNYLSAE